MPLPGVTAPVALPPALRVRVPATSANLGPGFDAFALALDLHDEVEVRVIGDEGELHVEVHGEGAGEVPQDETHLVVRAMMAVFDTLGRPRPGLALRCTNRIPQGRGLGSSAAAVVAGLAGARALMGDSPRLDEEDLLALAVGFEGHADNVAACLHGGLTLAWCEERPRVARLTPLPELRALAFVPVNRLATAAARALLPQEVPHADAAHAAARAGLLVEALTRTPELLLPATEDRLHQPYRSAGMPDSLALVASLRERGVPAVVSGAGPTVLALLDSRHATALEQLLDCRPSGFAARCLAIDLCGAQVERLS